MAARTIVGARHLLAAACLAAMAGSAAFGQVVSKSTGVTVTPHNLNSFGVAVKNQEVCRPCHTPHQVIANQDYLWNRAAPTGSYTLYTTAHVTPYASLYVGLDSSSKLCLSCHDGAVAVDNYGGATGGTKFVTHKVGNSGTLANDHPVGLRYPGLNTTGTTWTPTPSYLDPTSATFGSDGVGTAPGVQLVKLSDNSLGVGCLSCHNSHGNYDATQGNFLRTSMKYSYMCLKCHDI